MTMRTIKALLVALVVVGCDVPPEQEQQSGKPAPVVITEADIAALPQGKPRGPNERARGLVWYSNGHKEIVYLTEAEELERRLHVAALNDGTWKPASGAGAQMSNVTGYHFTCPSNRVPTNGESLLFKGDWYTGDCAAQGFFYEHDEDIPGSYFNVAWWSQGIIWPGTPGAVHLNDTVRSWIIKGVATRRMAHIFWKHGNMGSGDLSYPFTADPQQIYSFPTFHSTFFGSHWDGWSWAGKKVLLPPP